jgi:hypothetical protein
MARGEGFDPIQRVVPGTACDYVVRVTTPACDQSSSFASKPIGVHFERWITFHSCARTPDPVPHARTKNFYI